MKITSAEYHDCMAACGRIRPRLAPPPWTLDTPEAELQADYRALNIVVAAWACDDSCERRFYDRAMRVVARERVAP